LSWPERERSNWWYLLPIFLGIIGGIIAYFAIRYDDRVKAKKFLYLGLIMTTVDIMINVALEVWWW
jgi:hypothetical protein|tara:strand:- start:15 stop:212 length:198 start_codon:yes stop_codon:yes gene_type:complete